MEKYLNPISQLRAYANGFELISFDVFDTLFVRLVTQPEDVFDILGNRFGIAEFRLIREKAQVSAFRRMQERGRKEITLDDIYECMEPLLPGMKLGSIRNAEFDLELQLTKPNPDLLELFLEAAAEGRAVVSSDMYLPKRFFEELFELNKLPAVEFFISSETQATKRDHGELFEKVISYTNVDAGSILHIGDNIVSDVEQATRCGLASFHYVNSMASVAKSRIGLTDSVALSMSKIIARDKLADPFYFLGARFAGGIAIGFLSWLQQQSAADDIDVILFVSRDGYLLQEVSRTLVSLRLPASIYFHGSRVAFALAAASEASFSETLDFLLAGAIGLSPDEVLGRIGVPIPAKSLMTDLDLGDDVVLSDENLPIMRRFLRAYKREILKVGARNRRGLFNLLQAHQIRPGMRVALVDIGWSGTTQEMLSKALNGMLDIELFGYYLSLTDSEEKRRRSTFLKMAAAMESTTYSKQTLDALYANRVGIELMFSAPHGAVIGYDTQSDSAVSIIEDPGRGVNQEGAEEAVLSITRGALDFVELHQSYCCQLGVDVLSHSLFQQAIVFSESVDTYRQCISSVRNFDAWGSTRNRRGSDED